MIDVIMCCFSFVMLLGTIWYINKKTKETRVNTDKGIDGLKELDELVDRIVKEMQNK